MTSRAELQAERRDQARTNDALEALRFIRSCVGERGYPPSRRELAEHLGMRSPDGAQKVVNRLVEDGLIRIGANKSPRAITITESGMVEIEEAL
ncbi:MAG TPA: hypothetical protein PKV27_03945 [Ilumatobacteraceae bacterium]|nr:hypothetical protein [bacterium]HQV57141.1 hypothetical protein [Ilumatobacteraceae bacterium]